MQNFFTVQAENIGCDQVYAIFSDDIANQCRIFLSETNDDFTDRILWIERQRTARLAGQNARNSGELNIYIHSNQIILIVSSDFVQ